MIITTQKLFFSFETAGLKKNMVLSDIIKNLVNLKILAEENPCTKPDYKFLLKRPFFQF